MFHETVKRSDGVPYAVCILCNSAYKHRDLDDCVVYQRLLKTRVESSMGTGALSNYFSTASQPRILVTKEWVERQVLKFFISTNIPFRQADNEYFQELTSKIQVNGSAASSPSRKVIRARLSKEAEVAEANLKAVISKNSSKISLALDMWSTRNKFGFLGILSSFFFCEISFSQISTNLSSCNRPLD